MVSVSKVAYITRVAGRDVVGIPTNTDHRRNSGSDLAAGGSILGAPARLIHLENGVYYSDEVTIHRSTSIRFNNTRVARQTKLNEGPRDGTNQPSFVFFFRVYCIDNYISCICLLIESNLYSK